MDQDTEITLGTGRMLALFFTFVLVCAVFFAIGFSLGRKTTMAGAGLTGATGAPATVVRPSATKDATKPTSQATDFSFYKSVSQSSTNNELAPKEAASESAKSGDGNAAAANAMAASAPPQNGAYFVQVAAVSRQEDADALVDALKKKQYPASANNSAADKFFHVQVGPYADFKEAEAMRARLISDGYNPIVKK